LAYKGKYKLKNPSKYKGDPTGVVYRSLWELKLFRFLDIHPDVVQWQSEELTIPYLSPIDNRMHRYFPDVIVWKRVGDQIETIMIEVKPAKQTRPPDISKRNNTPSGRVSRRYLNEVKTWGINDAKWAAARKYCEQRGWKFVIATEHELGIR
jgi:hypothetical protein